MQRLLVLVARSAALPALQQEAGLLAVAASRVLGVAAQQQAARQLHASAPWWDSPEQPAKPQLPRQAVINRMLYRSRQRGFLELDLLIGMWAERELPRLPDDWLPELEAVLDQENPDMFKWLTGQMEAPQELQGNRVFQQLRQHVKSMTDQHHSVPSRSATEMPKEWVRGWTDTGADLSSGGSSGGSGGSGSSS